MKIEDTSMYPRVNQRKEIIPHEVRRSALPTLLAIFVGCIAANVVFGGALWCLLVPGMEYLIWSLLLERTLVESNIWKKSLNLAVGIYAYLSVMDEFFFNRGWAFVNIIPIVVFSALAVASAISFIRYKKHHTQDFLLQLMVLMTLCIALIGLMGIKRHELLFLIQGAGAVCVLLLAAYLYRNPLRLELKRKLVR